MKDRQAAQLNLLGNPQLVLGPASATPEVVDLPSTRPTWLLYYLAYYGVWMSRQELAFFFRPDVNERAARRYVRKLIFRAQRFPWLQGLEVKEERLRWRVATDVAAFRAAIKTGAWHRALELYRGELLMGLQTSDALSFEAWLEDERADLFGLWRHAALHYADDLESAGDHAAAERVADGLLKKDALDEMALQRALRNSYLAGSRAQALELAGSFAVRLRRELGVAPRPDTLQLVQAIRDDVALEPVRSTRRVGRRRSDDKSDKPKRETTTARHLAEVILKNPHSRVLKLRGLGYSDTGHELLISQRIPDPDVLARTLAELAKDLHDQGHTERAQELLEIALEDTLVLSCSAATQRLLQHLAQQLSGRGAERLEQVTVHD